MKSSLLFCLAAASALAGCTGAGSTFAEREPAPLARTSAYVPVALDPLPSDFCERIGLNTRLEATRDGFDAATQDRLALQSSERCARFLQIRYAGL